MGPITAGASVKPFQWSDQGPLCKFASNSAAPAAVSGGIGTVGTHEEQLDRKPLRRRWNQLECLVR